MTELALFIIIIIIIYDQCFTIHKCSYIDGLPTTNAGSQKNSNMWLTLTIAKIRLIVPVIDYTVKTGMLTAHAHHVIFAETRVTGSLWNSKHLPCVLPTR